MTDKKVKLTNAQKQKAFKQKQADSDLVQLNIWVHRTRKEQLKKKEKEWQKAL